MAQTPKSLAGLWIVTKLNTGIIPRNAKISLEFFDDKSRWYSTCNTFESSYRVDNSAIQFFPVMPGPLLCSQELLEAEKAFLRAMQRVISFETDSSGGLKLFGAKSIMLEARR